ncbi:MAG: hypothetical protein V2B19_15905 [Pseudomonadota bacterium]
MTDIVDAVDIGDFKTEGPSDIKRNLEPEKTGEADDDKEGKNRNSGFRTGKDPLAHEIHQPLRPSAAFFRVDRVRGAIFSETQKRRQQNDNHQQGDHHQACGRKSHPADETKGNENIGYQTRIKKMGI